MAMSGDDMGVAVARAIMKAAGGHSSQKSNIEKYWKVICNEIVLHIQANAKVKPGIAVSDGEQTSGTGDIE